ncbi:MAG: tail protein X [Clostridia bacterium]
MSAPSTYTTDQGDKWDSVCYKALGSTDYIDRLMMLNTQYLGYYIFPAGITLVLPIVIDDEASYVVPPWKEVEG